MRAFLAIPISVGALAPLSEDIIRLRKQLPASVRWINSALWHITLNFWGRISPQALAFISDSLEVLSTCIRAFHIVLQKIDIFPEHGGHNIVGYIATHDTLCEIHQMVTDYGGKVGIAPELKKYQPHITLAKINRHAEVKKQLLSNFTKPLNVNLPVTELILYESKPTAQGGQYLQLKQFSLLQ